MNAATSVLRRHGRSFYWAGQLLSPAQLEQAAGLYTLCRKIDDLADEATDDHGKAQADRLLSTLVQALRIKQMPAEPLLAEIYAPAQQLLADEPLACQALQDLIATMRTDLQQVRVTRLVDLVQYCYGAAGTVGVMMTHLLDAESRELALPHAIDLGIAMQMTNIARDVLEDAYLDRVYLPVSDGANGMSPQALIEDSGDARHSAWLGVCELLANAEAYYDSGRRGLGYLPLRPRLAIAVAADVYRDIGRQILHRGEAAYWQQRSVVSKPRKALLSALALGRLLVSNRVVGSKLQNQHKRQLHEGLLTCLDTAAAPGQPDER
jgi:phytoene synthase